MAEVGIKWHPVDGTDDEALRKELVLALLCSTLILSSLSVWKRWVRWHDGHASADSVYSSTALRMGAFPQQVAMGGPTAAVSVHAALRWWRVTLGVPSPVCDGLLRPLSQLKEVSHTPQSAPVLPLRALQSLLRLAADPVGFESQMASMVLTLVGICIRWTLAQRSVNKNVGDTFVSGGMQPW